ncbi:MAG: hypothetical protein HQL23_00105 [Candidatus Omnitrophica bacterium]|nr:hypothetical protein [Candidatus Omnitrophota bacterium]
MKKIYFFIFCLVAISVVVAGNGLYGRLLKERINTIWDFNFEVNRDQATKVLDCVLLYAVTGHSLCLRGVDLDGDIYQLNEVSGLYAKGGYEKRMRWVNAFKAQLQKKSSLNKFLNELNIFRARACGRLPGGPEGFPSEYVRNWQVIENWILKKDLTMAIAKCQNQPYALAKMGEYFFKSGNVLEGERFIQMSLSSLTPQIYSDERRDTLTVIIKTYSESGKASEAIKLYQDNNKSDLWRALEDMIRAFVAHKDYQSAFAVLDMEDYYSIRDGLKIIAEGLIQQKVAALTKQQESQIERFVARKEGVINR